MKKEYGRERRYSKDFPNRNDIVKWDVLKINKEQTLKVNLISKNSSRDQGVRVAVDVGKGCIECWGKQGRDLHIWWGDPPREIVFKVDSSEGFVSVFNMFRRDDGTYQFHAYHGGMIIEEKDNKFIYHCNDYGETDIFDKLVFSVEKL